VFAVGLYGCESRSPTIKQEKRLRVSVKRKSDEIKLVRMGLACRTHGKDENAYKERLLVRKPQTESLLG
jgi:hypothetical protein